MKWLRWLAVYLGLRACPHPGHPYDYCPEWEQDYS